MIVIADTSPINYLLNIFLFNYLPDDPFYFHVFNLSLLFLFCLSLWTDEL